MTEREQHEAVAAYTSTPTHPPTPSESPMSPTIIEALPQTKLKGKRRLLSGFQRISSSPSLARLGLSSSSTYKNDKASISCISLSSAASPYGVPFSASVSAELAFGPAASPTTSTTGVQLPYFDDQARVRYLDRLNTNVTAVIPRSAARVATTTRTATPDIAEEHDYFSLPSRTVKEPGRDSNFWGDLPCEIRTEVLSYLDPKEVIRCATVSKAWHKDCFDGQLWAALDTTEFYHHIPADALVNLITSAGPFVRDLNLRGCVQLKEKWHTRGLSDACRNLESFSLEGCKIDRTTIHCFLLQNPRLLHLNLSGLTGVTNSAMGIVARNCPRLQHLNVSWCHNVDTRGLRSIVEGCKDLSDLQAGEIRGWDDVEFAQLLFETNRLERLLLMHCDSLNDDALKILMVGTDSEIDWMTGKPIVPPRKLKHLDLSRCRNITDNGIRHCVNNLEYLQGLQLAKCTPLTDGAVVPLLSSLPSLTHLDLEELDHLTNASLQALAGSPCAGSLRHLSISYCENLGDTGMLPVLKTCTSLRSLEMDNTRISDLVLVEAAAMVRQRSGRVLSPRTRPVASLRLVAYDCQNVTWTGIREIISRNAEIITQRRMVPSPSPVPSRTSTPEPHVFRPRLHAPVSSFSTAPGTKATTTTASQQQSDQSTATVAAQAAKSIPAPPAITIETVQLVRTYPTEIISLKCFYNYQPTVHEHTKRVLRGDFASANRLERKWAEFMVANEEAGIDGIGQRRRRRRARHAQMMHADEADAQDAGADDGPFGPGAMGGGVGGGRRRRARSGGCTVM